MDNDAGNSEPKEDINAEIDRFLQKLREGDSDGVANPQPPSPSPAKKPTNSVSGAPTQPAEAPEKPAKKVRLPRAKKPRKPEPSVPVIASPDVEAVAVKPARPSENVLGVASKTPDRQARRPAAKILVIAAGSLVLAAVGYGLLSIDSVTISEGIATNRGPGNGQTVLIDKTTTANQGDLVVGVMPGTSGTEDEKYVMGTVFSSNDETYAVYDGNVVWQVPIKELRGKVLFATPEEFPAGN